MRRVALVVLALACCVAWSQAQTADELIAHNIQAKGGMEKISALKSLRIEGKFDGGGGFTAAVTEEYMRPNLYRSTFTLQGMTQVRAYDGAAGWQISPFGGHKDPELIGEDGMHGLLISADFDGPLVEYKAKGNTVEYLGHDTVDGDDALRLKVTLKNGDVMYYYLDPDTYLEIRVEKMQFIRGSVRESLTDFGSYKQVQGVYYPFSIETGSRQNPGDRTKITIEKMDANVSIQSSTFRVPAAPAASSPQNHPEPAQPQKDKPETVKPPAEGGTEL